MLSVTSSVVPLRDVLFEHRAYLASWGFFAAAAALGERLTTRLSPDRARSAVLVVVLVFGGLAATLYRRNSVWESREALWRDALLKSPGNPRPYLNLGWAYRMNGRYSDAIAYYRLGLDRAGRDRDTELKLIRNLGAALLTLGRADEALVVLRGGLEKAPGRPDFLVNIGLALGKKGDLLGAEATLVKAAGQDPANAWIWNGLGVLRLQRQDPQGALPLLERARAIDPDFAEAHFNAG